MLAENAILVIQLHGEDLHKGERALREDEYNEISEAAAVLFNSGKRLFHHVVYATTEVGEYIEWLDGTNQLAVDNLQNSLKVLAKDAGCYVIDTRNFLQSISKWKTPGQLEYNGQRMQEYGFQTIFERWLKVFIHLCGFATQLHL